MNRFLLYWLPLVIWVLGIFVLSSLPSGSYPGEAGGVPTEYILHVTAFFVLFLLCCRVLNRQRNAASPGKILLMSLGITLAVAVLKECLQIVAPTRTFSVGDMFMDATAALAAMGLVWISARRKVGYIEKP